MILSTFAFLEDKDVLVHATRCDYLTEFRVRPGDPPNRTIVLALNLEGADPLICQEHIIDLLGNLGTRGVHCTSIDICIGKV